MTRVTAAIRQDDGASAVEYGLLLAAIAAVIVAVIFVLGGLTRTNFGNTCSAWNTAASTVSTC